MGWGAAGGRARPGPTRGGGLGNRQPAGALWAPRHLHEGGAIWEVAQLQGGAGWAGRTPLGAWLRLAGAGLMLDTPPWGVAKAGRGGASGALPLAPLRLRGLPAPSQRKDL